MERQNELNEAWCKYMGKCSTEIMQALAFALRWCDQHPHWISVKDELPPKNEAFIAYWQHLGVTKYRYVKAGAKVSRTFSEHITHWMPMPQPPKKGGEE